jgi:RNA polymerase sigma factor (sigma-70 family)
MIDEKDLIIGCVANDRTAQKRLFDKYSKSMFTIAYRIVNDYDLAHDVLQDSFIEIFGNIKYLQKYSSLFFWIKTIVVRKSIKAIKSKNDFEDIDNQVNLMSNDFDDEFTADDLDKAIRSLPDGTRTIFLLIEVEGYKHKEVAEMLNIAEGTSKSQLNYAKKLLRNYLQKSCI